MNHLQRRHSQCFRIAGNPFGATGVGLHRDSPAGRVTPHPFDTHRTRACADVPQQLPRRGQQPSQCGRAQIPLRELAVVLERIVGEPCRPPGDQRSNELQRNDVQPWCSVRELLGRGLRDRLVIAADIAQDDEAALSVPSRGEQCGKRRGRLLIGREHQNSVPGRQFAQYRVHVPAHGADDRGGLCRPAEPRPRQRHRRHVRDDGHLVGAPISRPAWCPMPLSIGSPEASATTRRPASCCSNSGSAGVSGAGHCCRV